MGHYYKIYRTWRECNIALKLTCWIQCRTLLSSKTPSLQLQLLMLKLQVQYHRCSLCCEWMQQPNSSLQRCVATTSSSIYIYIYTLKFKVKAVANCTQHMLHAIVGLLDNSAHIDNYVLWPVAQSDTYTASDKCSVPEKSLATREYILFAQTLRMDHRCSYTCSYMCTW